MGPKRFRPPEESEGILNRSGRGARKKGENKSRYLYWLAASLSVFLLGTAVFGRDGLLAVIVNQRRSENIRADISALREGNRLLRKQIRSLQNDLTSVERIAREDLGLVKPEETVYEFIPAGEGSRRR